MAKREVTGKAVIYTAEGTKIVDCEARRIFNSTSDGNKFRINSNEKYLLIGAARTVPTDNIYAAQVRPELIQHALTYSRTKFFRLIIDLQRLAQFDPIHPANQVMEYQHWHSNNHALGIDFSTTAEQLDEQLYRKYGFTPAMIAFTEARYNYDDLRR